MTKTRHHFEQRTETDHAPKFLVLCLDGRRQECATAEEVVSFLWGKCLEEWIVYRMVPIGTTKLDEILRLLES